MKISFFLKDSRSWSLLFFILMLVCLNCLIMKGWLSKGLPRGHDAMAGLSVFYVLRKALLNLTIIGWNPYWYLGHPVDWRLPYIMGALIDPNLGGMKIYGGIPFIFSGIFMLVYMCRVCRNYFSSFVSAIFYNLSPFLLAQMFEGHYSHVIGYMLTPLIFLLIEENAERKQFYLLVLTSFAITVLILSYPQNVILVGPFVIMQCIFKVVDQCFSYKNPTSGKILKTILKIFSPLMVSLFLSTFWWLPMIFERSLHHSTKYTLESTKIFVPSILEVITLRPSSCCSPDTFGFLNSPSIFTFVHRLFIAVFALSALVVYPKNKYTLFFSITGLIAITLSMGIYSPVPLFAFAFKYIPFFDGIRTPGRFLMYASFAYSALAGLTMLKIFSFIKASRMKIIVTISICLLMITSVYTDALYAFQTLDLKQSQKDAMAWLSEHKDGRLVPLPLKTWVYDPKIKNIVLPWNYVFLHEKEVVIGGIPYLCLKNTAELLKILKSKMYNEKISSIKLLNILGVKYVVIDNNYKSYIGHIDLTDLNHSRNFRRVWSEDEVTIFENLNTFPRLFLLREKATKKINVFEDSSTFIWRWAQGTSPLKLNWSRSIVQSGKLSLLVYYNFTKKGKDWLCIKTKVEDIDFEGFDAINFWYYLSKYQPDVQLSISVFEKDGSRYIAPIQTDISPGWHKATVPFALMRLAYSKDENGQLDKSQISTIWIGVAETKNYEEKKFFSICFDNMTLTRYEYIFDKVSFKSIHPGKYQVQVKVDEPSYLVLSESYHPQWVAKDSTTGKVIARSKPLYIALNGFWLEAGEYKLILEYEESQPQKIGTTISVLTLIICLGLLAKNPVQKLLAKTL